MTVPDAIAPNDTMDCFAVGPINESAYPLCTAPRLEAPLKRQRANLEAIFHLHKQLTDLVGQNHPSRNIVTGQPPHQAMLVEAICLALRALWMDEAARRYVVELEDEEVSKMLELLQTVRVAS